jgi:hypothetical protein
MTERKSRANGKRTAQTTPRDAQKGGQGAVGKEHPETQLDQGEGEKIEFAAAKNRKH